MYLGIDIGGSAIKYAILDDELKITSSWDKETKLFETKDLFYDYLCEDINLTDVEMIGVSAPGVINANGDVLSKAAPNVLIMQGTNVVDEVGKRTRLKCGVINDAKAAGYAEFLMGNGKGTTSSLYFIIGTGVGGCLCDKHGVIIGKDGLAGEFSAILVNYDKQETSALAQYASMSTLIELYKEKKGVSNATGKMIGDLYLQNDVDAVYAVDVWCTYVVKSLYSLNVIYNPDIICLGGGISQADWFIEKIREEFKAFDEHVYNLTTTKIDRCKFDNAANLVGAVLYAKNTYKD